MNNLNYNKFKYILFILLLLFFNKFSYSQEKNYLDSVIQRINDLELELRNIQTTKSSKIDNKDNYTNSIASHEQRLIELEEEIRNLTGGLEEINFKIDNIFKLLNNTELSQKKQKNNEETSLTLNNNDYAIEPIEKKQP